MQQRRIQPSCAIRPRPKISTAVQHRCHAAPGPVEVQPSCVDHNDWRGSLECGPAGEAPIVCLGKFDSMHRGHASLAAAASALGGQPVLLSFSGMAEVLGWPQRAPLVAPCDRNRVLASWAGACGGRAPRQHCIPFDQIRRMPPAEFVQLLARELKAAGVVAGENYRFGFKAAGDAAMLQALGAEEGMAVSVVPLLGSGAASDAPTFSSSRVRELLAAGRVVDAAEFLGRPYRLVAQVSQSDDDGSSSIAAAVASSSSSSSSGGTEQGADPGCSTSTSNGEAVARRQQPPQDRVLLPSSCLLNQPPAPGRYRCSPQLYPRASASDCLLQLQQQPPPQSSSGRMDADSSSSSSRGGSAGSSGPSSGSGGVDLAAVSCQVEVTSHGLWVPAALLQRQCMASVGGLMALDVLEAVP